MRKAAASREETGKPSRAGTHAGASHPRLGPFGQTHASVRPAPPEGTSPRQHNGEGVTVNVLVVDDQAPFRRAMAAVVDATDGFTVVGEAASGEESLSAYADLQPDLVLMDVNLPGIDGVEASRRLRALPTPPVVLLLSTYDADSAEGFVAKSGAAAYVTKGDFGPDVLNDVWVAAQ